jgi:hypothetical protein
VNATRFQVTGAVLLLAGVLMLAGAFSRSWADGRWKIDDGDDEALAAGPLGVRNCRDDMCYARAWSTLREESGSTWLGPAVGYGEMIGGGYALVIGLLAVGGSVRALRPPAMRWGFAALEAAAVLFALRLITSFHEGSIGDGMVFGLLGPLLAFLALRRVSEMLVELIAAGPSELELR